MRLISGCLRATSVEYLPILSGIALAHLRRNHQTIKLAEKRDVPGSLIPPLIAFEEQRVLRNHFDPRPWHCKCSIPINHRGLTTDGLSNGHPLPRISNSLSTAHLLSRKVVTSHGKFGKLQQTQNWGWSYKALPLQDWCCILSRL